MTNGINSLSRQAMLEAHAQAFPEAVSVFNLLYGVDAPALLFDDNRRSTVVWSQGCAAGTYLFCVGIAPVVAELRRRYPEFVLLVLTDDVTVLIPPPRYARFYKPCQRLLALF